MDHSTHPPLSARQRRETQIGRASAHWITAGCPCDTCPQHPSCNVERSNALDQQAWIVDYLNATVRQLEDELQLVRGIVGDV